jgi:hypothetical protein
MGFFENGRFCALFVDFLTKSDRKMAESRSFWRKIWAPSFLSQKEGSKSQGEKSEDFEKNLATNPPRIVGNPRLVSRIPHKLFKIARTPFAKRRAMKLWPDHWNISLLLATGEK